MQGINLPAKNLIARNPNLFTRKTAQSKSLTPYEFGNLRGRAGRLLKDFVGRAIVLDETAFEQSELDLSFPEKDVEFGFQKRFEENREQIVSGLKDNTEISKLDGNQDLLTRVRQALLRYGNLASSRLAAVRIHLSQKELDAAGKGLKQLSVPIEICLRHPYWDPLVLDIIFLANKRGSIARFPESPFAHDFQEQSIDALDALQRLAPYYYDRYFGEEHPPSVRSIVSAAQKWAAQDSLRSIVSWNDGREDAKEIDRRIRRVQQEAAFNLPKIIKPLVAMQNPNSGIIGMIETGAHQTGLRRLIEFGLPRETAIRVGKARGFPANRDIDIAELLSSAWDSAQALSRFDRDQVQALL